VFASISDLADAVEESSGHLDPIEAYDYVRTHIRPTKVAVESLIDRYNGAISAHSVDGHVALEATLSIEMLSARLAAVEMIAAAMVMLRTTEGEEQAFLRLAIDEGASVDQSLSQMLNSVQAAAGEAILPVFQLWKDDPDGILAAFRTMTDDVRTIWDRLAGEARSR